MIIESLVAMPIYEYRCEACGRRSTALLATFSSPDPACPHCGERKCRRLVSTFATVRSEDGGADFGEEAYGGGEFDQNGFDQDGLGDGFSGGDFGEE